MIITAAILEATPKKNGGFRLKCLGKHGEWYTVHTFVPTQLHPIPKAFWKINVKTKRTPYGKTYLVTNEAPQRARHPLGGPFDYLEHHTAQYDAELTEYQRRKEFLKQDGAFTWDRLKDIKEDVDSMYRDDFGTDWRPTCKSVEISENVENSATNPFENSFDKDLVESERKYGNRLGYYVNPKTGLLQDSEATAALDDTRKNPTTLDFPESGYKTNVDSAFAAVALRERHVVEFYTYFLLVTYLKKNRRYPNAKKEHVTKFLMAALKESRRTHVPKLLRSMEDVGMIQVENGKQQIVHLLGQAQYVRKWEKAYNGRARNAFIGAEIKRQHFRLRWGKKQWVPFYHTDTKGNGLRQTDYPELYEVFRPYFTLPTNKTTKIDTGFANLINESITQMKAFLYELWITSFNEYPICRTKIAINIAIGKNTQIAYERLNPCLQKRYNHLEIPEDMWLNMTAEAQNAITDITHNGGKFKRSLTGNLYRQEGNSYRSNRIKWVKSNKCAYFRLSQKILKYYQATQPVFRKDMGVDELPALRRIDVDALERKPKTYADKKDNPGKYFAARLAGVATPTSAAEQWRTFEPFDKYCPKSGNKVVPQNRSFIKRPYGIPNLLPFRSALGFARP